MAKYSILNHIKLVPINNINSREIIHIYVRCIFNSIGILITTYSPLLLNLGDF